MEVATVTSQSPARAHPKPATPHLYPLTAREQSAVQLGGFLIDMGVLS